MSPRRALFGSILLCMVAWQIVACTTMQPHRQLVIFQGCDGKDHAVDLTIKVGLPALECLAVAVQLGDVASMVERTVGFPTLACTQLWPENEERIRRAEIWFAPFNFDFVVQHEMDHVKGHAHPRFLPFVHSDECPT